jgi:tRNA dimethylallyltransferase
MGSAPRTIIICGPTASGKSALGVRLAHAMRARGGAGEIVTADALQVYRRMDVGTAKPTPTERAGVPHHLLDLLEPGPGSEDGHERGHVDGHDPQAPFTVERWLTLARGVIAGCHARGSVPIVVGGTHLYVKALLDGLFDGPKADAALRATLDAMDPLERRAELQRVDPLAAQRIHPNDQRRTVRALEVYRLTGTPISQHQTQWKDGDGAQAPPGTLLVTLRWDVEPLNRRINARVRAMIAGGLVEEVGAILAQGGFGPQAREALGYKQVLARVGARGALPAGPTLDEVIERIKIETRRLAKNQRTWLKRLSATPGTLTLDADPALDEPSRLAGWTARVLGALDARGAAEASDASEAAEGSGGSNA